MKRGWDPGPDCQTCLDRGTPDMKANNVRHHDPEQRAAMFADPKPYKNGRTIGDYWSEYYADIPYHPFRPVVSRR